MSGVPANLDAEKEVTRVQAVACGALRGQVATVTSACLAVWVRDRENSKKGY
jgi:hypothetical protein